MTNEAKAREAHRDEAFRMYDRGGRGSNMAFGEYYDDSDHPFLDAHLALMRDLGNANERHDAVIAKYNICVDENERQAAEIERLRTALYLVDVSSRDTSLTGDEVCAEVAITVRKALATPEEKEAGDG